MDNEDTELMKEFAVESQEHLADIENQLLTLEAQGDNMDVALVNTVFRAIHSIKGAAGFMGLDTLGGLAHRAEEVLNRLRNKELRPTSVVINTLLRATDRLKELIDEIESSNEADVSSHLTALQQILNGEDPTGWQQAIAAGNSGVMAGGSASIEPGEETPGPGTGERDSLAEALREFLIESFDNLEQTERDLLTLERQPNAEAVLNSVFRNVHTVKGSAGFLGFTKLEKLTHAAENLLGAIRGGQITFDATINDLLLRSVDGIRRVLHAIESSGSEGDEDFGGMIAELSAQIAAHATKGVVSPSERRSVSPTPSPLATAVANERPSVVPGNTSLPEVSPVTTLENPASPPLPSKPDAGVRDPQVPPSLGTTGSTKATASPSSSNNHDASAADSTIRVDVALLDKLMTRVGELVLARNQILQFNNAINDSGLQSATQRLNLITTELQEGVMKTRMQPIGNVWGKFPRLVRDLATMCGKEVRIEMEGKDTELDKTIIEAIKDPLTHLVRNTVDHGIEKPEIRRQHGKPTEGCLTLKAYHEGGQVNIEIVDDGAGLNIDRIKAKAIEKGLISPEQAAKLADRDVGQLIFLPGFSTAEKVSNVSGRGVGMDVVKTNIEKIGGTVDLQSQPGRGTTIKIKIPLTLAIIPALIVTSDDDRYAIPQVNLLELVRLEGEQTHSGIEWIQGAPVYRLRGRLLPLVDLRHQLGMVDHALAHTRAVINIVVLRADDRPFGLVVDQINDSEEIVVKPLSKQLKNVSVYAGTTIMGDGRVALILDVMGLAQSAHVVSESRNRSMSEGAERSGTQRSASKTLLVLGVGEERRFALPIEQVTRLEKIAAEKVECADHQEVVQYRGEILPLIRLSETLSVPSRLASDHALLDVVVYTEQGRSVGLVVDQIIDIVEAELSNIRPAHRAGLLSSAVIDGHVTDLVDLPAVIRMVDPTFFHTTSQA